jgi:hypothetical protein
MPFWIRDTGWDKKSGSGMNNPDHISESLATFLGLKYLHSLMRIRDGKNSDPGFGMEENSDPGSGINIPDPQHFY